MRISAVKTAVVEANYDYTFVRVFAGDEYGTGEAFFAPGLTAIIRELAPVLIGKDARHVDRRTRELRRAASGAGAAAGYAHNAISGIEAALWDLVGKHFRVPIWQFFGGQLRDRIAVYADCHAGDGLESWGPALQPREPAWFREERARRRAAAGYADEKTSSGGSALPAELAPARVAERARQALGRGFRFLKFDADAVHAEPAGILTRPVSAADIDLMTAWLGAIRAAVGPDVDIALDCHWRYGLNDAVRIARAVEPYRVAWLEDALPPESIDGFGLLRQAARVPVCTGENLYLREGFKPLLERHAVDIISPDFQKTGGLLEGKRIADLAALFETAVAPHNIASPLGTLASCHVCATLSNFLVLEFHGQDVPFWEDLVVGPERPLIRDGVIRVPEAPGLGAELNEAVAREYRKRDEGFFE